MLILPGKSGTSLNDHFNFKLFRRFISDWPTESFSIIGRATELSKTICQRIVDYVKKDANQDDVLSALDALIFSTQILPVPTHASSREEWAKGLIEEVLNSYTERLKQDDIKAINEQNFSFRDEKGNILPEEEIKAFYGDQTPENFQIKQNLIEIKERVENSLDELYKRLHDNTEFDKLKATTITRNAASSAT